LRTGFDAPGHRPGRPDPPPAKRADRVAADRRPGGRHDPALCHRLYRLPAAGSAGLIASAAIGDPGEGGRAPPFGRLRKSRQSARPAIFFQPARARGVTLSRFLATTSQFTMTGLAPAAAIVSATYAPPTVSSQPMIVPMIKRMEVPRTDPCCEPRQALNAAPSRFAPP